MSLVELVSGACGGNRVETPGTRCRDVDSAETATQVSDQAVAVGPDDGLDPVSGVDLGQQPGQM